MRGRKLTLTSAVEGPVHVSVDALADHIATRCSFVHYYDAAETAQDDRIHPQDWALPALLQAPWQAADPYARILDVPEGEALSHWNAIEAQLAEVKTTWSLEDENSQDYTPAALALMRRAMSTPWVKAAVATKLLHKKRPNLIPVVDRELWAFYRPTAAKNTYPSATEVCDVMFGPFCRDLRDPANQDALRELQRQLALHENLPKMTRVRLLEMTAWLVRVRPAAILR